MAATPQLDIVLQLERPYSEHILFGKSLFYTREEVIWGFGEWRVGAHPNGRGLYAVAGSRCGNMADFWDNHDDDEPDSIEPQGKAGTLFTLEQLQAYLDDVASRC